MNPLIKAAFLPAATYLANKSNDNIDAASGGYVGLDLSGPHTFAGVQSRISSRVTPLQFTPSFEASGKGNKQRWQLNADVMAQLGTGLPLRPYSGAGVCLVRKNDEGKLRPGVNILGGVHLKVGKLAVFAQLRMTVADGIRISLTGGATPKTS